MEKLEAMLGNLESTAPTEDNISDLSNSMNMVFRLAMDIASDSFVEKGFNVSRAAYELSRSKDMALNAYKFAKAMSFRTKSPEWAGKWIDFSNILNSDNLRDHYSASRLLLEEYKNTGDEELLKKSVSIIKRGVSKCVYEIREVRKAIKSNRKKVEFMGKKREKRTHIEDLMRTGNQLKFECSDLERLYSGSAGLFLDCNREMYELTKDVCLLRKNSYIAAFSADIVKDRKLKGRFYKQAGYFLIKFCNKQKKKMDEEKRQGLKARALAYSEKGDKLLSSGI